MSDWVLHEGDCVEVMRGLPAASVDAIVTDPPYFRIKDEPWDRKWANDEAYLAWLASVADEWHRLLRPNGSLYCFASSRMAARVEVMLGERFHILNNIRWAKDQGWASRQCKEEQRAYFPNSETILFAEHYGADGVALGESGWNAKCDELRGFVFEPLRRYFEDERRRCGISMKQIMDGMESRGVGRYMFARHTFTKSQWQLPTREQYEAARDLFDTFASSGEYLRREYEDLRREYEDLRREYEDLRRPFQVSRDVPFTDVWTFPTVPYRRGKHPCEKPLAMLRHILRASTRPGAVVLDCFAGSASTGVACLAEGRQFIGIECCPRYCEAARHRLHETETGGPLFAPRRTVMELCDSDLEQVAAGAGRKGNQRGSQPAQRVLGLGLAVSMGGRTASVGMGAARGAAGMAAAPASGRAASSSKPGLGVGGDCPGGVCR